MKEIISNLMKNKVRFYVNLALTIFLTIASGYLIYSILLLSGIETLLRTLVIFILILFLGLFYWLAIKMLKKGAKWKYVTFVICLIIYILVSFFIAFNINKVYSKIRNVSNSYVTYSSSLITKIDNTVSSINKIGDAKIGILNDENNIEAYQIPQDIIKDKKLTNEIVYYDSYLLLVEALENNEVKYIFLPTNYKIMFQNIENISEILKQTKIIYTEEKQVANKIVERGSSIDKPFTMLLMGVDSEKEDISSGSFNGDALMVITFNPNTLNTTIVSIPRDTYVPIACFSNQRKNKITHAAWYGEECMIKTIENFLDIDIDYYFKINFKGVVKLVDALGGIEVDVPYSFCEQDSNRRWGKYTVYVKEGLQKLNGEQALALARNRHNNADICGEEWNGGAPSDIVRGQNQQLVIKGILNSAKNIRKIETLYEILDTISLNMETNMQVSEILSFYNVAKDILVKSREMEIEEILGLQKLYISGYSRMIMDYSAIDNQGMRMKLYNFIPYQGSVNDVIKAMKINLGIEKAEIVKTLSFSVNEPYEEKVIGSGYYNEAPISLLPNFIGEDEQVVVDYAKKYNFKLNVNYITSDNSDHKIGEVVEQFPYAAMDIDYVKDITIDVVKEIEVEEEEEKIPNCSLEENKKHSLCLLPNFVGQKYLVFKKWLKKYNWSIKIIETPILMGEPGYSEEDIGNVIYQSKKAGTSLYDLIGNSLEIQYIPEDDLEEEDNEVVEENEEIVDDSNDDSEKETENNDVDSEEDDSHNTDEVEKINSSDLESLE